MSEKVPNKSIKNTLGKQLKLVGSWLSNRGIKVNEQKCNHVTFTLKTEICPILKLNNVIIPQANQVRYLGIHLDRQHFKLKDASLNWLLCKNSGICQYRCMEL